MQSASTLAVSLHLLFTPLIQPHASHHTFFTASLPPTSLSPTCLPFLVYSAQELFTKGDLKQINVLDTYQFFFSSLHWQPLSTKGCSINMSPFSFFIKWFFLSSYDSLTRGRGLHRVPKGHEGVLFNPSHDLILCFSLKSLPLNFKLHTHRIDRKQIDVRLIGWKTMSPSPIQLMNEAKRGLLFLTLAFS